jgi:hypothetical protein
MNILSWFLPVRRVEFVVNAPLESCLEQVEDYQTNEERHIVALRPQLKLSSIKNGKLYELWAGDSLAGTSLRVELERNDNETFVSGYASFNVALVFVFIVITGLVFYPTLLSLHDVPLLCLFFPVLGWAWIWFTYAMRRGSLIRHVRNILKDATIRKRH